MVGNSKIEEEEESDEGDGDNTIGANDKCLKKPTQILKTIMDFSLSAE